jgi:Resolvase, N terminal domain
MKAAVAYIRVSTGRQGRSGLGLEAQKAAVEAFPAPNGFAIVARFEEVACCARSRSAADGWVRCWADQRRIRSRSARATPNAILPRPSRWPGTRSGSGRDRGARAARAQHEAHRRAGPRMVAAMGEAGRPPLRVAYRKLAASPTAVPAAAAFPLCRRDRSRLCAFHRSSPHKPT